jgi:universal stress protein A
VVTATTDATSAATTVIARRRLFPIHIPIAGNVSDRARATPNDLWDHASMSRVLLASDGSDLATAAMVRAIEVLGRGHEFHSLSVVSPAFTPSVSAFDSGPIIIDPAVEEEIEQADKAESSADLAALDDLLEIRSTHLIEVGEAGPTICRIAGQIDAEVIAIGSQGHGWLQRVLLGSVSQHVVRHAPCAVFVVRLEAAEQGDDGPAEG